MADETNRKRKEKLEAQIATLAKELLGIQDIDRNADVDKWASELLGSARESEIFRAGLNASEKTFLTQNESCIVKLFLMGEQNHSDVYNTFRNKAEKLGVTAGDLHERVIPNLYPNEIQLVQPQDIQQEPQGFSLFGLIGKFVGLFWR